MTTETMKILDAAYFEEEGDELLNPDLIPVDMSALDDTEEYGDTNEITIKQVRIEDEPIVERPVVVTPPEELDVIGLLLKNKGITDPKAILFEEEDGTQTTRDFDSLTKEEQLELLESNDADINYGLEDTEVEAINFLRENKVTLDELIEYHRAQAIEEFQNSQNSTFEIDNYTDEELYVLDLKTKFEELSNEELEIELTKALENPDLFKKKADRIRNDYKTLEEESRQAELAETKQSQDEAFAQITNALVAVADQTEDMYGIELEEQDKEDIINSIIDRDLNGVTPLVKALDDPNNLFKAAWFVSKGEEAFNILHQYYRKEIEDVRKASYDKGKSEALKGLPSKPINRITIPQQPQASRAGKPMSIDDLHNIND